MPCVTCSVCGSSVEMSSPRCLNCGSPTKKSLRHQFVCGIVRFMGWILALVFLSLIVARLGSC